MKADPMPAPGGTRVALAIDPRDAGLRLDRAVQRQLPQLSRSQVKQLILEGHVLAPSGPLRDPAARVAGGLALNVTLPEPEPATPAAQAMALDIRFEDEHLIVVDKPAGLVVHPAPGNPDLTLVNALLAHCGMSLAGIGGERRPGIVHRLDKDTSGLLVAAKTEAAHRALSHDFAARRIDRAYAALVWGVPIPPSGEIAGNIGRSPTDRKKMAVLAGERGKPAVTRYRVERRFGDKGNGGKAGPERGVAAFLECRLLTGRTHQIRVHLAHKGHPLIGDPVYGNRSGRLSRAASLGPQGARIVAFPRQALHARRLGFTHPATGEFLAFDSPIPADMAGLAADLELL